MRGAASARIGGAWSLGGAGAASVGIIGAGSFTTEGIRGNLAGIRTVTCLLGSGTAGAINCTREFRRTEICEVTVKCVANSAITRTP